MPHSLHPKALRPLYMYATILVDGKRIFAGAKRTVAWWTAHNEVFDIAVNFGDDTDTTAAVTGGLAGLLYGYRAIPESWRKGVARADDIEDLCN